MEMASARKPKAAEMAVPAPLERKTQCYIATLLNRETNRLAEEINRMIEEKTEAAEVMDAIEGYRRARDERDAFAKWIKEQEAEG